MPAPIPKSALLLLLAAWLLPPQATTVYHSDSPNFTFTYPADFKPLFPGLTPQDLTKPLEQAVSDPKSISGPMACVFLPLMTARPPGDNPTEMLTLTRLDLACLKKFHPIEPIDKQATQYVTNALKAFGAGTIGRPIPYKVDGNDAVFVPGTAIDPSDHTPYYAGSICSLVDQNVLCWTVVTKIKANVTILLGSPIAFGSHPPQPLVPPEIFAR